MMNSARSQVSVAALVLLLIAVAIGCQKNESAYVAPPPPTVTVSRPVRLPVTPFLEENGVIEAVRAAEVRSRVRGFVESIEFEPGQAVQQGDLLYQIERDQYQASVNSAQAAVASAEATIGVAEAMVKTAESEVTRAEQELGRQKSLFEQNAGSKADYDEAIAASDVAKADVESAMANVQAAIAEKGKAEANLAQAQLDLDYTEVKAPISGRISKTNVKEGNLVDNGGQLATVVDRSQVFANFAISDREMLRFMQSSRDGMLKGEEYVEPDWSDFEVYLSRESDQGFPFAGVLNYVDQEQVDVDTGTLAMRAKFENADDRLFPGLFVTVRVPSSNPKDSLLLPEYAVLRDQRGYFVLTVDDKNIVQRTPITVAQTIGGWSAIESGIADDSRVVVEGVQKARPDLEVTPKSQQLELSNDSLVRGFSAEGDKEKPAESPESETGASEEE